MTNTDIVRKLIGNIDPVGESNTDSERFENLKAMCLLINELVADVDDVAFRNKERSEYSIKRSGEYADKFIRTLFEININKP